MRKERKDLEDEIIGKRVRVERCEANVHDYNEGCVCRFIGKTVTIEGRNEDPPIEKPSYKIKGRNKNVRPSEVTLLK